MNRNTAAYYFQRLRQLIADELAMVTPVGGEVEGEVVSFTSHGAMVDVDLPDGGRLHCYIPLTAMASPPPTKATAPSACST